MVQIEFIIIIIIIIGIIIGICIGMVFELEFVFWLASYCIAMDLIELNWINWIGDDAIELESFSSIVAWLVGCQLNYATNRQ